MAKNCVFFAGGMIAGAALLGVQSVRWMRRNEVIMDAVKREVKYTVRRKAAEVLYPQQQEKRKVRHDKSDDPAWLRNDSFQFCFRSLSDARAFRDAAIDCVAKYGFATVKDIYDIADLDTVCSMSNYAWDDVQDFTIKDRGFGFSCYYIRLPVPNRI